MEAADATLIFEAVKVSLRQTKDGAMLTLAVHPNDFPSDLFKSWVGTRYQCVLVELNDQDEPVPTTESKEGKGAVARAGMLCREIGFQHWMHEEHPVVDSIGQASEETAATGIYHYCQISSRSELKTNERARSLFEELLVKYNQHLARGL
jgi:hypothetical protein